MADMIPAKGEGAAHQLPMPPDRLIAAHLVLGPAKRMLHVFVTLLDPHAHPVEPDHLFQAGWRERWGAFPACAWGRQVGHQIPGREVGQRLGISRGYHGAFLLVGSIWPSHDLHHPPALGAAIAKS